MRIRLTPELEAYCAEHKIVVTDGMELDDAKLAEARQMWSRQHPDKDSEEIELHAIGLVAAQVRPAPKPGELFLVPPTVEKRDWKDAAWKIAVLILLLLIAIRGHAQIDVIKVQDNAGLPVGTIAAPFTFKAGANCTWAKAASTYTFNCAGGAAGAGGVNTQVQWNSTGSLAGISSLTTDGTITTALAGADWLFADLTTPTKKFQFDASNISAVTTRTMNVPDANATFAQAISAVSHKFITQMSAQGVFTLAQPDYSDLTGTPTLPVTIANASHKWLNSYTSGTGAFTQTQPDYSDLTGTPTLPANTTATGSNFFTAYNSTTGAFTKAQPAFTDVSGTLALASAVFANQGTTTTVLHGNGAGNPSFATVTTSDLASKTGTGTQVATGTGTYTSGNCVKIDANGNLVDNGSVCGGGSSAQMFAWNAAFSTAALSSTTYAPIQGSAAFSSDGNSMVRMSHACSFKNLRAEMKGGPQPASGTLTVSLNVNSAGVNSALVVSFANADGATSVKADTTHSVAVNAGDSVDWIVINNATATSGPIYNISADCQ